MKPRIVIPVAVLAVVLLLALSGKLSFLTDSLGSGGSSRLTGIVAANEVIASAKFSGRVEQLDVTEGLWVKQGDLIAVLDRSELEAQRENQLARVNQFLSRLDQSEEVVQLERARSRTRTERAAAELQVALSQREQTVAELDQNRKEADRALDLLTQGLVPKQEYERLDTAMRVAEANLETLDDRVLASRAELELARANERQVRVAMQDVDQARAQLEQAQADLRQIEARLASTEVRAPLDGTVSRLIARQGEVVRQGDPIATIVDLEHVWVRAEVEERDVERIVVGQPMRVQTVGGETMEGELTFISPEAEFATQRDVSRVKRDIRTFAIKVSVPNPEHRLHSGMTAYVMLEDATPEMIAEAQRRREARRKESERKRNEPGGGAMSLPNGSPAGPLHASGNRNDADYDDSNGAPIGRRDRGNSANGHAPRGDAGSSAADRALLARLDADGEPGANGHAPSAGPGVTRVPVMLTRAQPEYTRDDYKKNRFGTIVLQVHIDPRGKVQQVEVQQGIEGNPGAVSAAITAVLNSTYLPATQDGVAVRGRLTETFVFRP